MNVDVPTDGDSWSITVPLSPPSWWMIVGTAVLALAVTVSAVIPRITRVRQLTFGFNVLGTMFHEAGHAFAGCLSGGGVYLIRIDAPDSGVAYTWHYSRGSAILISVTGYATPPLAGLGAASLLSQGHAPMVLALTVVVTALVVIVARGVMTLVSVVAVGLVAFAALRWGTADVQHGVAYTETWLLLFSEIAGLWNIVVDRFQNNISETDDATDLAEYTGVPAMLWITGWITLIGWSLWKAIPLLWPS